MGREDVIGKDLREMGTAWDGVKREASNRLRWRRNVHASVDLGRLSASVSCKK